MTPVFANGMADALGDPPAVLVRTEGFTSPYQWCAGYAGQDTDGDGTYDQFEPDLRSLGDLVSQRQGEWRDFESRIEELSCARSGDIILIFDMKENGYHTVHESDNLGQHGSPSQEESIVPLAFSFKPLPDDSVSMSWPP